MKVCKRSLHFLALSLFALTLCLLTVSGCSGGWGEAKPTITGIAGSSGSSGGSVNVGQTLTLTANPTGVGPFTYQWFKDGVPIAGATNSSYSTVVTASDNGAAYTVAVTNAAGTVMSSPFVLNAGAAPSIATQPMSQTVVAGQPASFTVAASGSGSLTYQWYENGAAINGATASTYTDANVTVAENAAIFTVVVTNSLGKVTSAPATLTVSPLAASLSIAPVGPKTYGDAPFALNATSSSPAAISYTVGNGPATVFGSTITITGAGSVTVTASQAATGNYAAGTATTTFTVGQATPTLSLASIGNKVYGATVMASATSNSSGAITYSVSPSSVATITGATITITGLGTATVTASQAATANYTASTATTTFTVGQATPTLNLALIGNKVYGATVTASATSNSSGAITYSVSPSSVATLAGTTITITGLGNATVTASQAATADYTASTATTTFTVGQATPALSLASIPNQTLGATVTASATSSSSGVITYSVGPSSVATIAGTTITTVGVGTATVTASQPATADYAATTATTTFMVLPNVTLSAIAPAGLVTQPTTVTFTTTVTGGTTNNVTWTATGGTFNGNVWTAPNTAGTYTITATSAENPSDSQTTTVTVSKPIITTQPVSKNVCVGNNPSLSIGAQYATSYQWYFNANTLADTSNMLTFNNVTLANSGNYSCAATNGAGSVTSHTVTLNVVNPTTLTIASQPSSVSAYATQTATFAVGASGTGTLLYQWYTGTPGSGTAITGATASAYTTGALTVSNSGTTYYVTVTDPDCTNSTLTSSAATLTVSGADTAVPPTIVTQPTGQTATVGGSATFSVTASGSGTLTYQWYRVAYTSNQLTSPTAGVLISGATNSTYTVPSAATAQSNDGDTYFVVVTNAYGSATSNRAPLATGAGILLQATSQPQTEYIAANTLASFSVGATCTGCIPAYQWYWYAPGSTTAVALADGAVSTGALSGATLSGSTTSSLTLQNTPTTASAGTVYVVVTSTSDGTSQLSGTHPLSSRTAGLFVGSLGSVGNSTAGMGLCNTTTNWALNGSNPGTTSSSNVPYQNTGTCTIELTNSGNSEAAAVYWPQLISTAKFSIAFTVQISPNGVPADGFTMVLADPTQGATTHSIGVLGEGLGASGIPGFVLGFDTYQNGLGAYGSGCTFNNYLPCDPVAVPYMAVGQGASSLWENPWTFVNGALNTQNSDDYSASAFANATHSYVVSVVDQAMTVTLDGHELFTGTVSLPPAAYLGFTASTGGSVETVIFSNLTATVSAP